MEIEEKVLIKSSVAKLVRKERMLGQFGGVYEPVLVLCKSRLTKLT